MRVEKDFLGIKEIPDDAFYGIHTVRACENFPCEVRFSLKWYESIGEVKWACYETYERYYEATLKKYPHLVSSLMPLSVLHSLKQSAQEMSQGMHYSHFRVPALCGGAGTSFNMNANEILSNRSLQIMNQALGSYHLVDPFEHANVFQSTNDVIPTALKIAIFKLLQNLEHEINATRMKIEEFEKKYAGVLRSSYTQMQEAVPSSWGRLFGAYNEALSRDWWRMTQCMERIKVVHLGGGASGTGLSIPRFFIFDVVSNLQKITHLPLCRAEHMTDANSNLDTFVEVSGILKTHAMNMEKMLSDIRLLASDIHGQKNLQIPKRQVGSSMMPGKVNPVICEYVISICHEIYSKDSLITSLSGQGCLDLNAYLPSIGNHLIQSLEYLISAQASFRHNLLDGMLINDENSLNVYYSPSISTALLPFMGYHEASLIAKEMAENGLSIFDVLKENPKYLKLFKPEFLLQLGFRWSDFEDIILGEHI